jgi:fatty-acyl-CoA synthase
MGVKPMEAAKAAYSYPLLIKQLLHTPMMQSPHQEIVYRDLKRMTYAELNDRIGRLASTLWKIGVQPGDRLRSPVAAYGSGQSGTT